MWKVASWVAVVVPLVPTPCTVTTKPVTVGVLAIVVMVRVDEAVVVRGTGFGLNMDEAPEGRADVIDNATEPLKPFAPVRGILVWPAIPAWTVMSAIVPKLKSGGATTVP
jgi:hypothetical protein